MTLKSRILSILTAVLAIVAMLGALDLSGFVSLIPGANDGMVSLISGGLATLLTIGRAIGDLLDDGKVNNSFRMHWLTFLLAVGISILAGFSMSCSTPGDITLRLNSPWGSVESMDGATTIAPRPIVIPAK